MRTHEQIKRELLSADPHLADAYAASEPAYLVAREVINARGELGVSQAELARRMGTSQSVISRLENMEGSPNLRTVVALAEALGRKVQLRFVDPDSLVGTAADTAPDWLLGSREEFLEGFARTLQDSLQGMKDLLGETQSSAGPRR